MNRVSVFTLAAMTLGCRSAPPATRTAARAAAPDAAATPRSAGLRAERARLLAAEAVHAAAVAEHGMADGFAAVLADDALYLAPGAPIVRGKAEVRALLSAPPLSHATGMTRRPERVDVSADGRAGYTYGYAAWTQPDSAGAAERRYGKYISYWRKGADGEWRVAAFVLAPGAAPAPADGPPAGFESPATDEAPRYPSESAEAGRRAVAGADSAFAATALAKGIPAAFAEFAAPDGAVLSGGPGITYGPEAIGAGRSASASRDTLRWAPVIAEVAPSGDLGFTVGQARYSGVAPDGMPAVSYSKYLTVWRKQPSGAWRYVVDGGNARPATPYGR